MYWLKQKKVIWIALAIVFIVVLFFTKSSSSFKSETNPSGLSYNGNEKVGDLVNRDTDKDGVPDWQEGLFGTDPTKKDTNDDGIPDNVEIARRQGQTLVNGEINLNIQESENLTETDKLSRELFSTLATLNQAGPVDQTTIDALSSSLAEKINDSSAKKIFTLADIKVIKDDSVQATKNYYEALGKMFNKYPYPNSGVLDVLDRFIVDENTVDESVLTELDPIIGQINKIINDMAKMNVPQSLASLHLDVLNTLEKLSENVSNIRLYDTDVVVAMSGINQYGTNTNALGVAINNLANAVSQRLK